jgi:hypothetical protein
MSDALLGRPFDDASFSVEADGGQAREDFVRAMRAPFG